MENFILPKLTLNKWKFCKTEAFQNNVFRKVQDVTKKKKVSDLMIV